MNKFAIAHNNKISQSSQTSTADAVATATPMIQEFCKRIMEHYTPEENCDEVSKVQALFNSWPDDPLSARLAQLVEALTGEKPSITKNKISFGKLWKYGGDIYVTTLMLGNFAYGIDSSATRGVLLDKNTSIEIEAPTHVSRAEAGQFAKKFLDVPGPKLLNYGVSLWGGNWLDNILKEIGPGIV
jgi:hypothetical protein